MLIFAKTLSKQPENTLYQHYSMKIVQMCVEDWKILLLHVICVKKSIENPETKFLLN